MDTHPTTTPSQTTAALDPRITVILNVDAKRSGERIDVVTDSLERAGLDAEIVSARGPELFEEARRAASQERILVAAGGDGTVSTVAAAALMTRATLGVLPLGTLNHFARDAGIPLELDAAVATIARRQAVSIDVGDVNGLPFLNNASVGAYPRVVWEREIERNRGRGKWTGFAIALWRVWTRYRVSQFFMSIDGRPITRRTPFVLVGNGEYQTEGFAVGTRSSLGGRLSVFVAPDCGRFEMLALPIQSLTRRLAGTGRLERFSTADATIETGRPQISITLDGELMLASSPLRFTIRPRALRVLRPAHQA
jgi:diacylglycerol kinase family enzyme